MKKRAWMSIVLLTFVTAGAVFAQSPTLDKLTFTSKGSGSRAYYEVKALNTSISGAVVIPGTYNNVPVTQIPRSAFNGCAGITSITILNGLTSIDSQAFRNCTSLASVTIPASVTSIGSSAFTSCTNLTSVTFERKDTSVGVVRNATSFPGDLHIAYQAGGAGTYTRPANGNNWTKQGGIAAAPAPTPSLDGNWRFHPDGNMFIYISDNTAVFTDFARNLSQPQWQSAKDKGLIKVGDQCFRNIRSTGNSTWSGQQIALQYNTRTNEALSKYWRDVTITTDGVTFTVSNGDTWIRAGVQ